MNSDYTSHRSSYWDFTKSLTLAANLIFLNPCKVTSDKDDEVEGCMKMDRLGHLVPFEQNVNSSTTPHWPLSDSSFGGWDMTSNKEKKTAYLAYQDYFSSYHTALGLTQSLDPGPNRLQYWVSEGQTKVHLFWSNFCFLFLLEWRCVNGERLSVFS